MSVRVGFPVVSPNDGKAFPVWIETVDSHGPGGLFWNGDQLNTLTCFLDEEEHREANATLREIAQTRKLTFHCYDASVEPTPAGQVQLRGKSYGLAIELSRRFLIDFPPNVTSILLTGELDDDQHPKELLDPTSLLAKGKCAVVNSAALLLLQHDYALLDEESGRIGPPDTPVARLPSSLEEVTQSLRDTHRGRAWVLPISSNGNWTATSNRGIWWGGLGRFLDLTEWKDNLQHVQRPNGNRAASLPEDSPALTDPTLSVKPNTVGALFARALPSERLRPVLNTLLIGQKNVADRLLFAGGVAAQALELGDQLFWAPEQDTAPPQRNVLIGGPAGCGKSFLAHALMLNEALENDGHVVYVCPTRSLARECYEQLHKLMATDLSNKTDSQQDVILSTGETYIDDWRLYRNLYRIGVLVNEKANLFLRPSTEFLSHLSMVVIDELQMLSDPNRGGILDMLLAKIGEENTRRWRDAEQSARPYKPVRIVGISTEALLESDAVHRAVTPIHGSTAHTPIGLVTPARDHSVEHVVRVYAAHAVVASNEIHIAHFRSQDQRQLSTPACRQISNALINQFRQWEKEISATHQRDQHPEQATVLNEVIHSYCKPGYRSVLLAHPSIPGMTKLASILKNKRRNSGVCVETADVELQDAIARGEVGASLGKTLLDLSALGIYMHHSDLPSAIRELVQNRFRSPREREDKYPEVLFATETLFYGVNLTVECVVLVSPMWTRQSPDGSQVQQFSLTANELHNILGRAGRPGYSALRSAVPPKAIICLPAAEYSTDHHAVHSIIEQFYGVRAPGSPTPAISALFILKDIDDNDSGALKKLDELSHPTFRSVMDALRHASGPEKVAVGLHKVMALLKRTIFYQQQLRSNESFANLVTTVLTLSEQAGLVTVESGLYRITAQAEALVDTGTKWQSVAPMKQWMNSLLKIKVEFSPERELPVELLVPAFVSSGDFWNGAKAFCWETYERAAVRDQTHVSNEVLVVTHLKSELRRLGLTDELTSAIELGLSNLVIDLGSALQIEGQHYRKAVFYRLIIAILRWLRGGDLEDIAMLSLRKEDKSRLPTEARQFKERYADRASWLSVMCLRYFEKSTPSLLLPEHHRDLPRLGQRLREGVPGACLPFVAQPSPQLNRKQAVSLYTQGTTPAALLRSGEPTNRLLSSGDADLIPSATRDAIVRDVYRFYNKEVSSLAVTLAADEASKDQWQRFTNVLKGFLNTGTSAVLGTPVASDEAISEYRDILREVMTRKEFVITLPQKRTLTLALDASDLTIGRRHVSFSIATADEVIEDAIDSIVIRLPWGSHDASRAVELTACGGMVLAYMIGRGYLKNPIGTCTDMINGGARGVSVQEIADLELSGVSTELQESLLRFNEPGVELA